MEAPLSASSKLSGASSWTEAIGVAVLPFLRRARPPDFGTTAGSGTESGRRPLHKKGKPTTPAASVQPEAPDNLLEVLNGASIDEEHRTIMSVVIQKVQSAKSGLTQACASLLTGFEVSKEYVNNISA